MIPLAGLLLAVGFTGAGLQDWETGFVSDSWILWMGGGALLFLEGMPGLWQAAVGALLLVYGISLTLAKLLGTGDVLPMALSGLVLGLWAAVPLITLAVGLRVHTWRTGKRHGPALAFFVPGFLAALLAVTLL